MGIIKLAIIGGAGYYIGKKLNEPHPEGQLYGQQPGQGYQGGWCNRRKWHEHQQRMQQQQQQQQQERQLQSSDPAQAYGEKGHGTSRDNQSSMPAYQDYPEKAALTQQEQYQDFPAEYHYNRHHRHHQHPWQHRPQSPSEPQPDMTIRDVKPRAQSPNNQQIVMSEVVGQTVPITPPAYGGFNHPMSPQQRMYPGNPAAGMPSQYYQSNQPVFETSRSESAPLPQPMNPSEQKKPWSVENLMWK